MLSEKQRDTIKTPSSVDSYVGYEIIPSEKGFLEGHP